MKVWLGHYKEAPTTWFVCWGETKEEAINFVDCDVAEPDWDSVRPLAGPGMIQFVAAPDSEAEGPDEDSLAELSFLPTTERHGADHPRLDMQDWERITHTIQNPPSTDGPVDVSTAAARLGVTDPRVMATYAPRCAKCRKRHFGECSPVSA